MKFKLLITLFLALLPLTAFAESATHIDFSIFSLIWGLPFIGIILSIAIFPLVAEHFWHHHFGKIAIFWAIIFLIPLFIKISFPNALDLIFETIIFEYLPFIILLFGLFTASGGVRVKGTLQGKPLLNITFLCFGALIASIMGTTGAAMLLIRPLIRANEWRKHQTHIYVFFIFMVANIGGSLSPLGDPPLFLGFLKGVNFFWPLIYLWKHMLFVNSLLLIIFALMEIYFYRKEPSHKIPKHSDEKIGIDGKINIIFVLMIAGMVLLNGVWKPQISYTLFNFTLPLEMIVSNAGILLISGLSIFLTHDETRQLNGFTWFPIIEVSKLFLAIFITIIPVIEILKIGETGKLGAIINLVNDTEGTPIIQMYYWVTGILSSFLDNAPTYLVFFNVAGGNAELLMTRLAPVLIAISAGAVFMGAMTYIGNAPNFMVRSIVEENKIKMPSFFGYMIWSCSILLPVFILMNIVFF